MTLAPKPSRSLEIWWAGVHLLGASGLIASALPAVLIGAGLAALLAHAWLRRPSPAPALIQRGVDGRWALPANGVGGLALGAGTAVGPFWVELRLEGPEGRLAVLLLRDQLDGESWRALQAQLRRGS
ncbi:MAG TPA: protein YgfX [Gammaproteobacteria bacterium]|nr:protein YgfX [Gammaproteobacteria bacterium]